MQAEAPVEQVAGGGRFHNREPDQHRQDRYTGQEEEKAHVHRSERKRRIGKSLSQVSQAVRAGDQLSSRHSATREGGGQGLVLQPQTEREAHDAAWAATHTGGRVFTGGKHGSGHAVTLIRLQEDVQRYVKHRKRSKQQKFRVPFL